MRRIIKRGDSIFMDPVRLNRYGNPLKVRSVHGVAVRCLLLRSTRTLRKMWDERLFYLNPVYYQSAPLFQITTIKSDSGKTKYRRYDFLRKHHALLWCKRITKRG